MLQKVLAQTDHVYELSADDWRNCIGVNRLEEALMGKQTTFLVEVMPFIGGQLVIWQSMQVPQFCGFIFSPSLDITCLFAFVCVFVCLIWDSDMVVLHAYMGKQTMFVVDVKPFIGDQLVIWQSMEVPKFHGFMFLGSLGSLYIVTLEPWGSHYILF